MSIEFNLEFMKDSKELLDGIERLTRLMEELEIEDIQIYQVQDRVETKVIYKSLNEDNCYNYFICTIQKGILEHYFDVYLGGSTGNIYDYVGDFGFTPDQVKYLKYGNENLYVNETDDVFDGIGQTFSETELREWWNNEYKDDDPNIEFDDWLEVSIKNKWLTKYNLFETDIDKELKRLFDI